MEHHGCLRAELVVMCLDGKGKQAGRGNNNPTMNAKSLAWESRLRRIDNRTEENKASYVLPNNSLWNTGVALITTGEVRQSGKGWLLLQLLKTVS